MRGSFSEFRMWKGINLFLGYLYLLSTFCSLAMWLREMDWIFLQCFSILPHIPIRFNLKNIMFYICFHAHSRVRFLMATHRAPLSMGFSRQEYWSGLPFPSQPVSCISWIGRQIFFNTGLLGRLNIKSFSYPFFYTSLLFSFFFFSFFFFSFYVCVCIPIDVFF